MQNYSLQGVIGALDLSRTDSVQVVNLLYALRNWILSPHMHHYRTRGSWKQDRGLQPGAVPDLMECIVIRRFRIGAQEVKVFINYVVDADICGVSFPWIFVGNCIIKLCTITYHILGSSFVYLEYGDRSQNRGTDAGVGLNVLSTWYLRCVLEQIAILRRRIDLNIDLDSSRYSVG